MNSMVKEIMQKYLQSPMAWDPKTGKIRFASAVAFCRNAVEHLWYDNVAFPKLFRAVHLCLVFGILKPQDCALITVGDMQGLLPEDGDIYNCIVFRIQPYMDRLWFGGNYCDTDFTVQDLLDLHTTAVGIGTQPTLF